MLLQFPCDNMVHDQVHKAQPFSLTINSLNNFLKISNLSFAMKKFKFFAIPFCLFFLAFSASGNNFPAPTDIVKAYFSAIDNGNAAELEKLLADDLQANAPFAPQTMPKQAWLGIGQGFKAAFPDMQHEISDYVETGYKVAVRGVFKGKNDGPMMGNPPTGNRVSVPFNTMFELNAAWKIKAIHVQFDQKQFESQLMAGLPDPAAKAELDLRAFLEAADQGDVQKAFSYCAVDAVHHFGGEALQGEAVKKRILGFKAGFPDIKRGIDEIMVCGNVVTIRGWVTGTNSGAFMGAQATGNKVRVSYLSIYKLDNAGKIAEAWVEFDRAAVEKQLKAAPVAGQK